MALAFAAGETILAAAERVDAGDRAGARAMSSRSAPRSCAQRRREPERADARRGRRRASRGSRPPWAATGGIADPLPLVVMLRGSGYGYL